MKLGVTATVSFYTEWATEIFLYWILLKAILISSLKIHLVLAAVSIRFIAGLEVWLEVFHGTSLGYFISGKTTDLRDRE